MLVTRRDTFKLALAGTAMVGLPLPAMARAIPSAVTLDNGFRAHIVPVDSGFISLSLILRSQNILHQHGLAHIMEHTSFGGAAGALSAQEVSDAHKDYIQDSNASIELGVIQWDASFLPRYLPQVLSLLSAVSLDQKFDTDTVAREARIVLEELYLEKYSAGVSLQQEFDTALYGKSHPHVRKTLDAEIAAARLPPERLAAELRRYAATIRLPANMDLFLAGDVEPELVAHMVDQSFGKYPYARGPFLQLPSADVTPAYRMLSGVSHELRRPMSEVRIGWNTGVKITDPEAPTLLALCEYIDDVLFKLLREKHGDTYAPQAVYEPDACSGIIRISVPSRKDPAAVEQRTFQAIQSLKTDVDAREASRFRDRVALRRKKTGKSAEAIVECLVRKAIDGASVEDLVPEAVTRDQLIAAARTYLPSHKGPYVRLALKGQ